MNLDKKTSVSNMTSDPVESINEPLSLFERLEAIEEVSGGGHGSQAKRYKGLEGIAKTIATEEIERYIKSCNKLPVRPDILAISEIIDDALNARRVRRKGRIH